MKPRGRIREIINIVGDIQDLIGDAIGNHLNDRDSMGFEKAQRQLQQAFELCSKIRNMYDPI